VERQDVAIDLHSRRSTIVRRNEAGEELSVVRVARPLTPSLAVAEAGPNPEVGIEATGGYWAVDALQAQGANVHLVHPSGLGRDDRL